LPLVKKDGLAEIAKSLVDDLRGKFLIFLDIQGSIGRRYRRMDELGTPFAITPDYQTLEDNTVTVRMRDSLEQERISIDAVAGYLDDKLKVV
jgi:glycyl-tRNA synthetase